MGIENALLPFNKASGTLAPLHSKSGEIRHSEIQMNTGDLIFVMCNYYHVIINSNIEQFSEFINKIHTLNVNEIKNILIRRIKQTGIITAAEDNNKYETEDKLLIVIGLEEEH